MVSLMSGRLVLFSIRPFSLIIKSGIGISYSSYHKAVQVVENLVGLKVLCQKQ